MLVACERDVGFNNQHFRGMWEFTTTNKNETTNSEYYVYESPNFDGHGVAYKVLSTRGIITVVKHHYRIISTFNNGRIVNYQNFTSKGWINMKFRIIDQEEIQAEMNKKIWKRILNKNQQLQLLEILKKYK